MSYTKSSEGCSFIPVPEEMRQKALELNELCRKDPNRVDVSDCADFCNINVETMRAIIDQGQCPFGFGKTAEKYGRRFLVIPTLKLYNWFTNGALYLPIQALTEKNFGNDTGATT